MSNKDKSKYFQLLLILMKIRADSGVRTARRGGQGEGRGEGEGLHCSDNAIHELRSKSLNVRFSLIRA